MLFTLMILDESKKCDTKSRVDFDQKQNKSQTDVAVNDYKGSMLRLYVKHNNICQTDILNH